MARRSSSSRWSRPATGKQIAALKAHGNYDGKYYSMGRASQEIGGSSIRGRRSSGGPSGGSNYSGSASTAPMASGLLSFLYGSPDNLGTLLQPALGPAPRSPLASSGSGPTSLLSQLLDVPDDLDSLVRLAMGEDDRAESGSPSDDEPVESVSFTVRTDNSGSSEPRIVVEAEVVRDSAFEGKPSLQVRFVGASEAVEEPADRTIPTVAPRSRLGYRPVWTPVLVSTPEELAEQMRVHWQHAIDELEAGVDPRMTTFLAGAKDTDAALAVLKSAQSPTSRFVLLQGLLDPGGPIQFQGLDLDADTFAEQIRKATAGDDEALGWLEAVKREQVLTSFAEVTGTSLAAQADFRLTRWSEQGEALIAALTMEADDAAFEFSAIRSLLTSRGELDERLAENRAKVAEIRESNPEHASFMDATWDKFEKSIGGGLGEYGLLEDWFFEETRAYLRARFRQSLPGQFAAALTPVSGERSAHAALLDETRRLAQASSTDPNDYMDEHDASGTARRGTSRTWLRESSSNSTDLHRRERIVQAVHGAITAAEAAGDEDLGTLVIAQEVLTYARWNIDGIRARKQTQETERQAQAAAKRYTAAQQRTDGAKQRDQAARTATDAARNLDQLAQTHAEAITRSSSLIDPPDPFSQSEARARLEHAQEWETAASAWLAAAEERERWAAAEADRAATPTVLEQLQAERDAAIAEQADAEAEQRSAQAQQQEARADLDVVIEARAEFEELMRPVREENLRRVQAAAEFQRQESARRAEANRHRAEEHRKQQAAERAKQDAENKRQEEKNQRQQDRARSAKAEIAPALERLRALPDSASAWRRKARAATRTSLEQTILGLQTEIVAPLVPPRTKSTTWPSMLSRTERYLGTVKKLTDYGAFVSLPAGADGLLRRPDASSALSPGELVMVEITDMPYGKPIVLTRVADGAPEAGNSETPRGRGRVDWGKDSRDWRAYALVAGALLLILGTFVLIISQPWKAGPYADAKELLAAGDYEAATTAFDELGSYGGWSGPEADSLAAIAEVASKLDGSTWCAQPSDVEAGRSCFTLSFQPHSDEALAVTLTFTNRNGRASGETREYTTHSFSNDMYVLGDVTAGFNDEDDGVPGSMASKLGIMFPEGTKESRLDCNDCEQKRGADFVLTVEERPLDEYGDYYDPFGTHKTATYVMK